MVTASSSKWRSKRSQHSIQVFRKDIASGSVTLHLGRPSLGATIGLINSVVAELYTAVQGLAGYSPAMAAPSAWLRIRGRDCLALMGVLITECCACSSAGWSGGSALSVRLIKRRAGIAGNPFGPILLVRPVRKAINLGGARTASFRGLGRSPRRSRARTGGAAPINTTRSARRTASSTLCVTNTAVSLRSSQR